MKLPAGTHLFYVEDAGVLFSEPRQELHLLNTTGAVIWSLFEAGETQASAARALSQLCTVDAQTAAAYVEAAVADWTRKQLLDSSLKQRVAQSNVAQKQGPPWRALDRVADERCYRILGMTLRMRFSSAEQARLVHPVLEHLACEAQGATPVEVDVVASDGRLAVYRDRVYFDGCNELRELAPVVKSLVWQSAVSNHDYFLDIHAGVVGDEQRCLLLPAPPGSGKSTLTASLVHAGFSYYSDEVALLEDATLDVFPVPLALCVKSTGIAVLEHKFPILRALPSHHRADGKDVTYMPLPRERCPSGDRARPAIALIFPRYVASAPAALTPLAKAAALKRLLDECMVVPKGLDVQSVEALVQWISKIPCHDLVYGSADEAVHAIVPLFTTDRRLLLHH
jgi:hypothetical protein